MTDRELLELAAKAAGIELVGPVEKFIVQFDERHKGGFIVRNDRGGDSAWNPLTDDGDALRLAVKLSQLPGGLALLLNSRFGSTAFAQCLTNENTISPEEFMDKDPCAATRRSIVRAAAEIGKAMP